MKFYRREPITYSGLKRCQQLSNGESMEGPFQNTDREIWRERPGDYYADSIHVTESGGIGMNVGGWVMVLPIRTWHKLADIFFAVNPSVSNWRWNLAMWLLKRPYKW